MVFDQKRMH